MSSEKNKAASFCPFCGSSNISPENNAKRCDECKAVFRAVFLRDQCDSLSFFERQKELAPQKIAPKDWLECRVEAFRAAIAAMNSPERGEFDIVDADGNRVMKFHLHANGVVQAHYADGHYGLSKRCADEICRAMNYASWLDPHKMPFSVRERCSR